MADLSGRRAAVISTDGVEESEILEPLKAPRLTVTELRGPHIHHDVGFQFIGTSDPLPSARKRS